MVALKQIELRGHLHDIREKSKTMTMAAIADNYKVSVSTIRRFFLANGIKPFPQGTHPNSRSISFIERCRRDALAKFRGEFTSRARKITKEPRIGACGGHIYTKDGVNLIHISRWSI